MSYHENTLKPYPIIFVWIPIFAYVVERHIWHSRGMTVQMLVCRETILVITVILLETVDINRDSGIRNGQSRCCS